MPLSSLLKSALKADTFEETFLRYCHKLAKEETRQPVVGETHPSSFGCPRATQLHWLNIPVPPTDPETLMKFQNGTFFHLRMQKHLLAAGIIREAEVPLYDPIYGIRGTADGDLVIPRKGILELKSMNEFEFMGLRAPREDHAAQVYFYLHMWDRDFALFLYENKNTNKRRIFGLYRDDSLIRPLLSVVEETNAAFHDKRLLPRPKEATSPSCPFCKWCAFSGTCYDEKAVADLEFPKTRMVNKHVELVGESRQIKPEKEISIWSKRRKRKV